jgi:hypothetical protein
METQRMKRCPYCAEEVQDAAVKCRFCGSSLNSTEKSQEAISAEVATGSPSHLRQSNQFLAIAAVLVAVIGGGSSSYHFWNRARSAEQRAAQASQEADQARQETARARQEAELAKKEVEAALAEKDRAERERRHATDAAESIRRQPKLLYNGTVNIPVGVPTEVRIDDADRYEEIFGSFKAAPDQIVTVLALSEKEFYKFKAREDASGHRWKNSTQEFSFAPDSTTCFLVVQHANVLSSAKVWLEVYGRPK